MSAAVLPSVVKEDPAEKEHFLRSLRDGKDWAMRQYEGIK
jgi:hypothetical protein